MAKRRDIVLARIFFSDSGESKVRPCIVLSGEDYNSSGFLLVAGITTAGDEYCIPITREDADCPLAPGSGARVDNVIKIPAPQAIRKTGRVTPGFYAKLAEKIAGMIK